MHLRRSPEYVPGCARSLTVNSNQLHFRLNDHYSRRRVALERQRVKVDGVQTLQGRSVDAVVRDREFHENELPAGGGIGPGFPRAVVVAAAALP